MGCIFIAIALALPRIMMVFAFLLTDWFGRGFETQVWPILGFVFMPYTTLAYLAAMLNNNHALSGGWRSLLSLLLLTLVIGVVVELHTVESDALENCESGSD